MKKIIILLCLLSSLVFGETKSALLSFNGGEISPYLKSRVDYSKYNNSCEELENMFISSLGPVIRRSGTKYINEVKDSNYAVRLIPFEYSKTDAYILEFGDEYIRFYRNGGQIQTGIGTEDYTTLTANTVAYWTFNDDVDSTTVADGQETYDGIATTDTEVLHDWGKVGTGSFDLVGEYAVEIADNSAFTFNETSKPFSLAGWIYVTDTSDIQTIISKWNAGTAREYRLYLDSDEKLKFELFDESVDLDADCVSQWKLNDNAATTAVIDSRSAHAGTATANTDTMDIVGKLAGAFNFAGTKAFTIADHSDFSFGSSTAGSDVAFSIALWTQYNFGASDTIISKWDDNSKREWKLAYRYSLLVVYIDLYLYDESVDKYILRSSYPTVVSNDWHLIVATYDGSETYQGINIYIDGVERNQSGTKQSGYIAMENLASGLAIGASYTTGTLTDYYHGYLDNVMVFSKELTSSEILSLWASGSGTEDLVGDSPSIITDDALTAGWHFVAATYDSTGGATAAGGMTLYVDGAVATSTAHNYTNYVAMEDTVAKVRIGSQYSTLSAQQYVWQDKLDDVAVFNKELSAAEVVSLYSTGAYELATTFDTSEVFNIQFAQSDNVMYLVDGNDPVQKLVRLNHDWWTIEDVNFITGPFMGENIDKDWTITPSATTGDITLTASQPTFNSKQIGGLWQIGHRRETASIKGNLASGTNSAEITIAKGAEYDLNLNGTWEGTMTLERSYDSGSTWEDVWPRYNKSVAINEDYSDSEGEQDASYRLTMSPFVSGSCSYNLSVRDYVDYGIVKIVGFTNSTVVSAEVKSDLTAITATKYWSEGYWSDYRGWPQTLEFYEQRLMFGGSNSFPQTIWASKTASGKFDDYENMSEGIEDNDALIYVMPGQNPIQWMLNQTYLLIGTLSGIGRWGSSDDTEAITPSQPTNYRMQAKYGSAYMQPSLIGDAVLYVERGGERVREFVYSLERDKFVAPDMTVLAEHITESGIKNTAFQNRPDSILWGVRNDGDIATFTYKREEEIVAWSHITTDGDFEAVAVIPSDDEDEVWVEVKRTIDGNDYRYIEWFQPRDWGDDQTDCWFVDSGLSFDGGDAVNITHITEASQATVTVATWPVDGDSVNLADGDQIKIEGAVDTNTLNGNAFNDNIYTISDSNITAKTFKLKDSNNSSYINSSAYEVYVSGGTVQRFERDFTNLSHLKGETVSVFADGNALNNETIDSNNAIQTDTWANKVLVGLPFTSVLKTMPMVLNTQQGLTIGSKARIASFLIDVYKTYGIENGTDSSHVEDVVFYDTGEYADGDMIPYYTGWRPVSFLRGNTRDPAIYLRQIKPLPFCVRAIRVNMEITE